MTETVEPYGLNTKRIDFEELLKSLSTNKVQIPFNNISYELLERIWNILTEENLTKYRNTVEQVEIYIRLLTIIGILNDFSRIAWNEYAGNNYFLWYTELNLPLFPLAVLNDFTTHQLDGKLENYGYKNDNDFFADLLNQLICEQRRNLTQLLLEAFRGESDMFLEFWKGTCPFVIEYDGVILYDDEEEDYILYNLQDRKLAAFNWVQQGCDEY